MTGFPRPGRRQDTSGLLPLNGSDERLFGAAALWFNRMYEAASADGVELRAVSGHRTYGRQKALWAAYKAGKGNLAARPGTSRHEYGQAVDIDTRNQTDLAVIGWLHRHGHRYGYTNTVPSELWHWQFMYGFLDLPPVGAVCQHPLPAVPPYLKRLSMASRIEVIRAQRILVDVFSASLGTTGPSSDGVDAVWGQRSDSALHEVQRRLGIPAGPWGEQTNDAVAAHIADADAGGGDVDAGTERVGTLLGEVATLRSELVRARAEKVELESAVRDAIKTLGALS